MANKTKSSSGDMGEIFLPVFELGSILTMKAMNLIVEMGVFITNKYIFKREPKREIKKIERRDLDVKKTTLNEDALGYSVTQKKEVLMNEIQRKRHTLIFGASGFGKSVLLDTLVYDDLKNDKPVIFIDPKGDQKSLEQFVNLCVITGRDYQVFSESYNGPNRVSLNPVKEGSVTNIVDRIHNSFTWSEEHYETLCYSALKESVKELKRENSIISIKKIHEKLIELSNPNNSSKIKRSDIEGILMRLENIIDSDFGDKLNDEGLSFSDVWDNKKCLYIGLPVLGLPKVARSLGKIILGDLNYSVYNTYKKTSLADEFNLRPIGVYIDELSAIITDEFIELLNKCRGAKMELTFAFQSPSDVSKLDPELCEQILENTANWFILKQRMEKGSGIFSESIGTLEGHKETVRLEDGEKQSLGSQRVVEELIVHHNIIKNLNEGQGILLRHSPTQVDLINLKYIDPKIVRDNLKFLKENDESFAVKSLSNNSKSILEIL